MKLKTLAEALSAEAELLGDREITVGYRDQRGDWKKTRDIDVMHDLVSGSYTIYPGVDGSPSRKI